MDRMFTFSGFIKCQVKKLDTLFLPWYSIKAKRNGRLFIWLNYV